MWAIILVPLALSLVASDALLCALEHGPHLLRRGLVLVGRGREGPLQVVTQVVLLGAACELL